MYCILYFFRCEHAFDNINQANYDESFVNKFKNRRRTYNNEGTWRKKNVIAPLTHRDLTFIPYRYCTRIIK